MLHSFAMLLLSALPTMQTDKAQEVGLAIAVTRNGVRLQASKPVAPGDLFVHTPFGRYSTPLDPVVSVDPGGHQLEQLRMLHARGHLDEEGMLLDLSTAGQFDALAELAARMITEGRGGLLPYETLESWGRKIDPVPAKVDYEDRVPWLWERALDKEVAPAVLAAARFDEEIFSGSMARNDRTLTIKDLEEGFNSKRRPWARRAAVRVATGQHESALREALLEMSLADEDEAVRDAAARGVAEMMPHVARQFWVYSLLRNDGAPRIAAAQHLGHHGGTEGRRALLYVLSAWDRRAPEVYEYDGRTMWLRKEYIRDAHVIRDRSHHYKGGPLAKDWGNMALFAPDAENERIDLGSKLKISRFDETFREVLLKALDRTEKAPSGRGPITWLTSHDPDYEPAQP